MSKAEINLYKALEALRLEVDPSIVRDLKDKIKAVREENRVLFDINRYDHEGDIHEKGLFIHIGEHSVFRFKDPDAFFDWVEDLQCMREEIEASWYGRNS